MRSEPIVRISGQSVVARPVALVALLAFAACAPAGDGGAPSMAGGDGNLITGQNPASSGAVAELVLAALEGRR